MDIYGYIHICQSGYWRKSLNLLLEALTESGLYEGSKKIYLCIVSNSIQEIELSFDTLKKCEVLYVGNPEEFERPTLRTIKSFSSQFPKGLIWYMHTKGITHFDTKKELFVLDWIHLLLYWNVYQWKQAVKTLQDPNLYVYGCNLIGPHQHYKIHFSGNFWWSKSDWIATLPYHIGPKHTDPEFWITNHAEDENFKSHIFCPFQSDSLYPTESSTLHYNRFFPKSLYKKRKNLYGFIYVANNGPQKDWVSDLHLILSELLSSKLIHEFKTLTLVGRNSSIKFQSTLHEIFPYFDFDKLNVSVLGVDKDFSNTESYCLNLLRTQAQFDADESLYWYAHTLNESIWKKKECKNDFLKLHLHFTVTLWKTIVEDIMIRPHQKNDVYGCNLYYKTSTYNNFFEGNFWWAQTSHIKKLDECGPLSIQAQEWIMSKNGSFFNVFSSGIDHLHEQYPRKNYYNPTLFELCNEKTDKNTVHSYLETYTRLFENRTVTNVLEIGIKDGGSIQLWHDYFDKATVYGIDVDEVTGFPAIPNPRLIMMKANAYSEQTIATLLQKSCGQKFDVLIDDGPHTLESMKDFVRLYLPLLSDRGVLIIEDLQDISWYDILKSCVPDSLQSQCCVYDLRESKNRYDDILFVLDLGLDRKRK
jgi:cephalosporin hydroxylase